MRQTIRALGWASNIFWIMLLFFTVTAVYSAFQLRPGFGEPSASTRGGIITASMPFYIDNGGFYDITNVNLTTLVNDSGGLPISDTSTFVKVIPHGGNVSITHNMTINISQMTAQSLALLLFNDSNLNVNIALKLDYANAVPIKISTNVTMPWGAPLSNLTLGTPTLTFTGAVVPLSFENHSYFNLDGTITIELVDNANQVVGEGTTNINVQPQSGYATGVDVSLSGSLANIREARLFIETSIFSYGPVVIPIV